ncbi:cytochrome c, mono- and diheme variants [Candidatus Scalindua japonica]|uniref:Cytochrome c, mono-and diheme variants n=1 Tax=Candidatus Scalindua japonica TaxID=1284222 RepID=A0A286U2V1_9BACT|nr:cytochrome c [Candidatus Scalindua japonica]GAX62462.1 cytochrome c, mono- and diheme variants [Candidatus Scalindua japonica]
MNILIKNYIIVIICFFVVGFTSINHVGGSEGQSTKNAQAGSEEPDKKYELIEKAKIYMTSPKEVFLYYCSPCHGKKANGKGIYFTIDLKPSPSDLTNVEYMAALTDDYLLNFITQGSAAMEKSTLCPPWGKTLDEGTIKGIIGYLRSLTIAKSKESTNASDKEEVDAAVVAEVTDQGTPQAVIWSVLAFLCAFFAIGAAREWKKLAKEGPSKKK